MTQATAAKHGEKWTCDKCGTKFYDLMKRGPNNGGMCPECDTELFRIVKLPPGTPRKPKSRSAFSRGGRPVPVVKKAEDEETEETPTDDDEADGLPDLADDETDPTVPGDDEDDTKTPGNDNA
ncbi:MAG: FYDLN acid domain-containing protein [Proteobacteria bacterium]|nr:FYDLN acid domain-containing protein [Pseudomonadota bacterium]